MNNMKANKANWPVVRIWTDGSACPENPGPGGWATLLQYKDHEKLIGGSTPWSSNIRMELIAVLRGIQYLKKPSVVVIYTDSQYIVDGFRNILFRNKLLKSHYDTWGLILHLSQIHSIKVSKVKAHSGNTNNERVDKAARDMAITQPGDEFMTATEKILEERKLREKGIEKKSWEY
ncbi:ribonuclease HI [bacterium]|nr:ribonuclease HI [bacterium]